MSLQDLNAVNTQEQLDYAKYLDQLGQFNTDRNFAFNQYLSDFDILQNQLASLQGQDSVDYNRWMDKVGLYEQKQAEETDLARAQVDAILAAGGSPSADLVGASGYGSEYVQALEEAYRRQAAQQAAGGGGRSSRSGGGKSKMTLTTAKQAANAGVFSDDVLAVLRENGYTDEMLKAIYGYEPNSGGSGTITDASQLGAAALNIANAMSRVNSPSQLGTWAERISDALDDGKITEAEAEFLLDAIGY